MPQQSCFQNADKMIIALNNSFSGEKDQETENSVPVFTPFEFSYLNQKPKIKFNLLKIASSFLF